MLQLTILPLLLELSFEQYWPGITTQFRFNLKFYWGIITSFVNAGWGVMHEQKADSNTKNDCCCCEF